MGSYFSAPANSAAATAPARLTPRDTRQGVANGGVRKPRDEVRGRGRGGGGGRKGSRGGRERAEARLGDKAKGGGGGRRDDRGRRDGGGAGPDDREAGGDRRRKDSRRDRDGSEAGPGDRGNGALDAPVQEEFILRAKRGEDGELALDTGDAPLYSEGFFEKMGDMLCVAEKNSEVPSKRCARLDGATGEQTNFLDFELRKNLRKRNYVFEKSPAVLKAVESSPGGDGVDNLGAFGEREVKKIDMRDKMYLAPLTTVGNLPFRRVCKSLGADITCGEMAVAQNLVQGQNSEWALLRRHRSEDLFGVQLAGSNVDILTRAAELVSRECTVDFVELNAGCPIDLVFNRGGGCSLMTRRSKFARMVQCMSLAIDVPLGVKIRTGVTTGSPNAHSLIPALKASGAAWVTVHGRSRKQRYSKLADWDYIVNSCGTAAQSAGIPLLGNGDCYHWRDISEYFSGGSKASCAVDGIMVARGALIKPWVFTEARERRDWDISSGERFTIYQKFARYGLDHWGADERGVETTRKFMLEWLSFLYRYVPVGLLETGSVIGMAHRAPFFRGRNELETLLGSQDSADWVRITEMLLGKAPDGFRFSPKHKSNAWGAESALKG